MKTYYLQPSKLEYHSPKLHHTWARWHWLRFWKCQHAGHPMSAAAHKRDARAHEAYCRLLLTQTRYQLPPPRP